MSDLISRQEAIDAVMDLPNCANGYSDTYDKAMIIGVLEELPPVQKEQTAEWVPSTKYKGFWVCSACEDCYIEGWSDKERKWRFCPQCGKKMGRKGV